MQGDQERKPKHRAECDCDPFHICAAHRFTDRYGNPYTGDDPDADCQCDPLCDGYADPNCDTHGIPIQPRKGSMGRRSKLL